MKHHLALAVALASTLAGCSVDYAPGTFRGRWIPSGTSAARPKRVAVVWNNADHSTEPNPWATVQEGKLSSFGSTFSFDFSEPPPEGALRHSRAFASSEGRYALGTVVLYVDTNGNDQLDTIPEGSGPIDTIVGVSADYWRGAEAYPAFTVRYVEGVPPETPAGLKPGYNVLLNDEVVADRTEMLIPLRNNAADNLYVCEALSSRTAVNMVGWSQCMGPTPLRVFGNLDRDMNGLEWAYFELFDAAGVVTDAEVLVNGVAVPFWSEGGVYYGEGSLDAFIRAGADNTVTIRRPGHPEMTWTVRAHGDWQIESPADGATVRFDEPLRVTWSAGAGVRRYWVEQNARIDGSSRRRGVHTAETFVAFPPLSEAPAGEIPSWVLVSSSEVWAGEDGSMIATESYQERTLRISP